jgi:energy-coupling factor transporter transmembrane protein EcfT
MLYTFSHAQQRSHFWSRFVFLTQRLHPGVLFALCLLSAVTLIALACILFVVLLAILVIALCGIALILLGITIKGFSLVIKSISKWFAIVLIALHLALKVAFEPEPENTAKQKQKGKHSASPRIQRHRGHRASRKGNRKRYFYPSRSTAP